MDENTEKKPTEETTRGYSKILDTPVKEKIPDANFGGRSEVFTKEFHDKCRKTYETLVKSPGEWFRVEERTIKQGVKSDKAYRRSLFMKWVERQNYTKIESATRYNPHTNTILIYARYVERVGPGAEPAIG